MRRQMLRFVLALAAAALPFAVTPPAAHADSVSTMLSLVNGLRSARGEAPLAPDPNLTAVAQQWSAQMASSGVLSHNGNLTAMVGGGWTRIGENVGTGGSLTAVFNALVASAPHFANMTDPAFNLTGIAVVTAGNGTLWITEDFEGRAGVAPGPAPVPAPPVTAPPTVSHAVVSPARPSTTAKAVAPALSPAPVAPMATTANAAPAQPSPAQTTPATTAAPSPATSVSPTSVSPTSASPHAPSTAVERSSHQVRSVANISSGRRGHQHSGVLAVGTGAAWVSAIGAAIAVLGGVHVSRHQRRPE